MSNFAFLQPEWPDLHDAASKAESLAYPDARTACFHARRRLEVMVHWRYKHDATLKLPYQDNLSATPTCRPRQSERLNHLFSTGVLLTTDSQSAGPIMRLAAAYS
jgi:hypothetical protein